MNNQILADYYEERGFVKKAQRLKRKSYRITFGYYSEYFTFLGKNYSIMYGYHGWCSFYAGATFNCWKINKFKHYRSMPDK